MSVRYLIVDDEPLARTRLERMLMELEADARCTQAGDGPAALAALETDGPFEACFLDVEMPGLSGFDVAKRWPPAARDTALIFVTAYPKYAVQAFQVAAVDYLLKPVDAERLRQTLARTTRARSSAGPTLLLKVGDRQVPVAWQDVICLKASQKLTEVVTLDREYLTDKSIDQLEEELPPAAFCRCHRSALVNVRHVLAVEGGEENVAKLRRNHEVPVSRRKKSELLERLSSRQT